MPSKQPKQAVLLIHGIGEQVPMETLRSFVDAVWSTDESIHHERSVSTVWSKPDNISKNFELRRLATGQNKQDVCTDFYEYYWAHMMHGTKFSHLKGWAAKLLLRKPSSIPTHLVHVWWLLIVLLIGAIVLGAGLSLALFAEWGTHLAFFGLIWTIVAAIPSGFLLQHVGDAARYLRAAPVNVARRHEIRANGVEVLSRLHECGDYDRIVVVGHSLGSVIGYDILTIAWTLFNTKEAEENVLRAEALDRLEATAQEGVADVRAWQRNQRAYGRELRENGIPWMVTDFITIGSPLAHAAILLAADATDLRKRQIDRELPVCPPELEPERVGNSNAFVAKHFTYGRRRKPHHAAVFGPTRWTNLYDPERLVLWGDAIGGPLRNVFGKGIRDEVVHIKLKGGLFTHTKYWSPDKCERLSEHIVALRDCVDLLDRDSI